MKSKTSVSLTHVNKHVNERGETLVETLVGLLIAGLSLVMLTTAMAASSQILIKATQMAEVYGDATIALVPSLQSPLPNTTVTEPNTVTVSGSILGSSTFGAGEPAEGDDDVAAEEDGVTVHVTQMKHDLPGGKTGITYYIPGGP